MSKKYRDNLSNLQIFCYERNMICKGCLYSVYNNGNCRVKYSILNRIRYMGKPKSFKEKGIIMYNHGYDKAAQEYESRLFDGPPKTEEELLEKYEDELDYRETEAEYQMDELWMERN